MSLFKVKPQCKQKNKEKKKNVSSTIWTSEDQLWGYSKSKDKIKSQEEFGSQRSMDSHWEKLPSTHTFPMKVPCLFGSQDTRRNWVARCPHWLNAERTGRQGNSGNCCMYLSRGIVICTSILQSLEIGNISPSNLGGSCHLRGATRSVNLQRKKTAHLGFVC